MMNVQEESCGQLNFQRIKSVYFHLDAIRSGDFSSQAGVFGLSTS